MPKHHAHEVFSVFLSLPLTYIYYRVANDLKSSIVFLFSMVFGIFFLSPDLDTKSRVYRRWSFIRFIWLPYMKITKHRSFISHFPVISSIVRAAFLTIMLASISAVLIYTLTLLFIFLGVKLHPKSFVAILKRTLHMTFQILLDIDTRFIIAFLTGISAGDAVHMLLDRLQSSIRKA